MRLTVSGADSSAVTGALMVSQNASTRIDGDGHHRLERDGGDPATRTPSRQRGQDQPHGDEAHRQDQVLPDEDRQRPHRGPGGQIGGARLAGEHDDLGQHRHPEQAGAQTQGDVIG